MESLGTGARGCYAWLGAMLGLGLGACSINYYLNYYFKDYG